jgi:hypothetical protein
MKKALTFIKTHVYTWMIFSTVAAGLILFSCKDKTDSQPPKQEIVALEDHGIDSALLISTDTVAGQVIKDSSLLIIADNPSSVITPVEKELPSGAIEGVIYVRPTDSIVRSIYMSQVGVREATGRNDGKDVEKYLHSVHLEKGSAWCAAFVKWCLDQANVQTTITGWSPTANNKNNLVYVNGKYKKDIQHGDVFTIYFMNLKRIGHTGFVDGKFGVNSIQTVEGNTNMAGSREGDGVYIKIRPKSSLYTISRWF